MYYVAAVEYKYYNNSNSCRRSSSSNNDNKNCPNRTLKTDIQRNTYILNIIIYTPIDRCITRVAYTVIPFTIYTLSALYFVSRSNWNCMKLRIHSLNFIFKTFLHACISVSVSVYILFCALSCFGLTSRMDGWNLFSFSLVCQWFVAIATIVIVVCQPPLLPLPLPLTRIYMHTHLHRCQCRCYCSVVTASHRKRQYKILSQYRARHRTEQNNTIRYISFFFN